MMLTPWLDILVFLLNIYVAIAYRGTIWGWIATAIVCWFVFVAVKLIRES